LSKAEVMVYKAILYFGMSQGKSRLDQNFLFDNVSQFFGSQLFTGDKSLQELHTRPWWEWLYIAGFNGYNIDQYISDSNDSSEHLKFKIGITMNKQQRFDQLSLSSQSTGKKQYSACIIYAWSIPKAEMFETRIKQFLKAFIMPDAIENVKGKTEITWGIKLIPLIKIMQLCISEVCLREQYIREASNFYRLLHSRMEQPPDILIENGQRMYGQEQGIRPSPFNIGKEFQLIQKWSQKPIVTYPKGFNSQGGRSKFIQYILGTTPDYRKPNLKFPEMGDLNNMVYTTDIAEANMPWAKSIFHTGDVVYAPWRHKSEKSKKKYWPCQIQGYGIGRYRGYYLVYWLAYRSALLQKKKKDIQLIIPIKENGSYKPHLSQITGGPTYQFLKEVTTLYALFNRTWIKKLDIDTDDFPTASERSVNINSDVSEDSDDDVSEDSDDNVSEDVGNVTRGKRKTRGRKRKTRGRKRKSKFVQQQQLLAQWGNRWLPVTIVDVLPDNNYNVHWTNSDEITSVREDELKPRG